LAEPESSHVAAPATGGAPTDDLTALLVAARDGDRGALAAFVRRTQADVRRLCAHLTDPGDADDVAQDVYLRVWRALPSFRAEAPGRAWLFGIARRACADAVRRRRRRRRVEAAAVVPPGPDPAGAVSTAHLVAALPPDQRAAFVLTQVVGLPYAEAAEVCGCPIGTIRSRVARARAELARLLAE
jgi:RNA polymerase sigma-70 factor (ECF subfamily)